MQARGRGGIILGGSASNFLGSPTLATYTGAKAFSRIFSESLWAECKPMGIDVLHMVISFTDTPAMRRLGLDTSTAQSPDDAAQNALDNMRNGPLLILGDVLCPLQEAVGFTPDGLRHLGKPVLQFPVGLGVELAGAGQLGQPVVQPGQPLALGEVHPLEVVDQRVEIGGGG